jgi:hypothetical protein
MDIAREHGRGADAHADLARTGLAGGELLECEEVRRTIARWRIACIA